MKGVPHTSHLYNVNCVVIMPMKTFDDEDDPFAYRCAVRTDKARRALRALRSARAPQFQYQLYKTTRTTLRAPRDLRALRETVLLRRPLPESP